MSQEQSSCVNHILAGLPAREYQRLEPYLTPVSLSSGTVLYHTNDPIDTIYFPHFFTIQMTQLTPFIFPIKP